MSKFLITEKDEDKLRSCHPVLQLKGIEFLKNCHALGFAVHITHGFRTYEEQLEIVKSGVVASPAGYSMHNYGLAFDICFDNSDNNGIQDPYNGDFKSVADIAKLHGLKAGFYFKKQDKPHFELCIKTSIISIKDYYEHYGLDALWKWLEKTDKEAFNVNTSAI